MLLVTSLLAVTGLAVYHSLINGLTIWQVSNRYRQEEDIVIFLDRISQDLRNSVDFSLIKFDGKSNKLSFATVVRTLVEPSGPQPDYVSQIGRVEYSFDNGAILRRQAAYGQALANKYGPLRPLVRSLGQVTFSYYVIDPTNHIVLKNRAKDQWPVGVLIEVKFTDKGEKENTFSKLIAIPSGNRL
jgi:hypothetical protein